MMTYSGNIVKAAGIKKQHEYVKAEPMVIEISSLDLKTKNEIFFVPVLTDAGFPNWNADMPMPLYTFFEEYDFAGKTIIPFVTHGGSGFSGTVRTIRNMEPDAVVVEAGLSVSRNSVAKAQADVKAWTDIVLTN